VLSPRRVGVLVVAGLLSATLLAVPVNAESSDGSSGPWVEAVTEQRQPDRPDREGMRLWSDIGADRSDGVVGAGMSCAAVPAPAADTTTQHSGLGAVFSADTAAAFLVLDVDAGVAPWTATHRCR